MQASVALVPSILISMLAGCHLPSSDHQEARAVNIPASGEKAAVIQQLIIKFKPDTVSCDADGIARFAKTIGLSLQYVRMMAGEACVVKLFSDNDEQSMRAQRLLRQQPEVDWAEADAIRRHF
jgi:hypothetical protein